MCTMITTLVFTADTPCIGFVSNYDCTRRPSGIMLRGTGHKSGRGRGGGV